MANFVSNVANLVLQYCTCCLHCCMFNSCMCCCAKCVGSDCVMCKCSLRSSPRFFLLQQLAKFVCACAFFATLQPSFPKLCQLMLDLFLEVCVAHAQVIEVFVCCRHATWFCNVASLVLALAKHSLHLCKHLVLFSNATLIRQMIRIIAIVLSTNVTRLHIGLAYVQVWCANLFYVGNKFTQMYVQTPHLGLQLYRLFFGCKSRCVCGFAKCTLGWAFVAELGLCMGTRVFCTFCNLWLHTCMLQIRNLRWQRVLQCWLILLWNLAMFTFRMFKLVVLHICRFGC